MKTKAIILTLTAMLLAPLVSLHASEVANLRCEYRENPVGIDATRPRLSWQIEVSGQRSEDRGQKQTAYQILVASSEELLKKDKGDLWDSGKVASDRSVAIPYGGSALESGRTCPWRVRVWDGQGAVSPWSETARWTMGKLKPEDWSARWIGGHLPHARRQGGGGRHTHSQEGAR
jgi:alpha-L-rhamnosidase